MADRNAAGGGDPVEADDRPKARTNLPHIPFPKFDWRVNDKLAHFEQWEQRMRVLLDGYEIPEEKWLMYILNNLRDEGWARWSTISKTVDAKKGNEIFKAFKKGMEISDTYWSARKAYLSGVRQGPKETAAELAVRVEDMVLQGKWPENETQNRRIDLYYKATAYYEIQRYIQDQTSREGNELTWEKLVQEAKRQERTVLEYKDFKMDAGNTGSTPTYDNPALNADAVGRFNRGRPQQRKGKGGSTGDACKKCGKRGHKGGSDCPAFGKKCRICGKPNHFEAVCYSRDRTRSTSTGNGKEGKKKGKKPFGKKGKLQADSVVLREVSPEGVNSILSAPTDTEDALKESRNSVLSGPPLQAEHTIPTNKFSCCEITSRPDGSSTAQDQVYTDTDPEGRLAIYTDILVRPHKTAKVTNMEVKVDPGAEASLMPVCHFRRLFPQLCLNGQPKEGVLQKADSRFESYSGDSVQIQGHITFQVQNIQTRRYRPIRFYVNDRESGPVLLGHAACHWLGMITVQCFNKARVHKKFIASVSKDGPERSSSSDKKSGPLRSKQDTYTDTGRLKNQVAKARAKKHRRRSAVNPWTDVTDGKTDTEPQPAAPKERQPSRDSNDYSVLSEPECPQEEEAPRVALDGPLRSTDSISTRKKKYWKPTKGAKTYYMNSECQLQCREDSQDVTSVASTKELPLSRLKPIYHEPRGMLITDTDHLKQLYPNSFDTLGSLRGEYDIKIDPNVAPVVQARRKVPIESREPIEAEIESLIQQDVLEEQIEPTPWVNSAMYPMKPNGQVRVCLDCQPLNKAIIREHHKAPAVEEIAHELAGAQFFTKADAHKAFLQIHLTPRARLLTVFNWHRGRLRYKRMPFGAKMSQDVFQMRMDQILEKCPGVIGIHDDVVIYGKTREEHDSNLVNFLNVCQEEGLTLNGKKLELRKEEITFFGALFTKEGMRPDPKKLQGIEDLTPPADKQQLQSFLGMVTYMGEFIPRLSHHTQPLRALLKKDTVFYWDEQINRSFQQLKHILREASSTPLRYYDRNLPVTVQADASIRGLGACLIQDGRPIAFASKSLTDAETRYANIERELLAVVFACLRFNTYLQGRQFTVESDHKPLEMIHLKAISNAPPRLQRMLLQLQKYDMTIKYRPGPEMLLADRLSRCPARSNPEIKLDLRVDYIAFNRAWIETLKTETIGDPVLGVVHQLTYNGWPKERRKVPRIARHYWDFRDELSTDDSLLLKEPCIVIPGELRETYLRRLHEGHLSAKKVQENAKIPRLLARLGS